MSLLIGASSCLQGAAGASGGAADLGNTINQSLRFRGGQKLTRTGVDTTTGSTSGTISFWYKRGYEEDTSIRTIFNSPSDGSLQLNPSTNSVNFRVPSNSTGFASLGGILRDPSAWYHVVFNYDSSNTRLWINGDLIGTVSTSNSTILRAGNQFIGTAGTVQFFEGYLAEFIAVEGQTLDEEDFGKYNEDGVWVPIEYEGTYGTNGFHLTFDSSQDSDPAVGIGIDSSGNDNDWTASGFDTASISSSNEDNDIDYNDTPTNNYTTLNPLQDRVLFGSGLTYEHGNLRAQYGGGGSNPGHFTQGFRGGKFYWEVTPKVQVELDIGLVSEDYDPTTDNQQFGETANGWAWRNSATRHHNGTTTDPSHTAFGVDDTVGILVDTDAGTAKIEVNGAAQSSSEFTNIPTNKLLYPALRLGGGSGDANAEFNFGQMPFVHTQTGYNDLATNNLPEPAIKNGEDHFIAVLDTGANIRSTAEATFTNGAFLIRTRADDGNDAQDNQWQWLDTVRGGNTAITFPFNTSGTSGNHMTTYDAPEQNSFAYCWNAGSPATNGFQIIEDSSPTTGNNVISHNLGKTPEFIFSKETNNSDLGNIYHISIGTSGGLTTAGAVEHTNAFRVTAVSDSSFTIADSDSSNAQIHYVWTSIEGFSKFGEYNSATPFVYTGFKPALLWIKKTGVAESWYVTDNKRNPNNPVQIYTVLNAQGVETTSSGDRNVDFLSNGFRIRGTDSQISGSAQYVYMCWAEHPFGGENAPPATAR